MTPVTTTSEKAVPEAVIPVIGEYIVKTPGTCSGEPRIAGTRIKVKHVYIWVERMRMTPAEVVAAYPHLTMAQLHATLAYYWSRQDEIHKASEDEEKLVAELKAKSGPSKLQPRPAELHAKNDSLSSGWTRHFGRRRRASASARLAELVYKSRAANSE
jgi:uncharacterized protein (DUF433 family)